MAFFSRNVRTIRTIPRPTMRLFSQFDGDTADIYESLFVQHMHPNGPWRGMLNEVCKVLPDGKGTVLDIASGPGEPACLIAGALPQTSVISSDFSEDMVAKATLRSQDLGNVSCQVVDAQDLSRFKDNSLDVVTCCYGFMFCPDPLKALQEVYRVLKPGGSLITTYWFQLVSMDLCKEIMITVVGGKDNLPPPSINPMSLAKPNYTENLLQQAGFDLKKVSISEDSYPFDLGNDEDRTFLAGVLPIYASLQEMDNNGKRPKGEVIQIAKDSFYSQVKKLNFVQEDGSVIIEGNTFKMAVATK